MLLIEGVFQELGTLFQDNLVQFRKIGGIIAYGILHEQYGLHSDFQDVVIGIRKILEQLDDGHYEFRIAVPAEYIVHSRCIMS